MATVEADCHGKLPASEKTRTFVKTRRFIPQKKKCPPSEKTQDSIHGWWPFLCVCVHMCAWPVRGVVAANIFTNQNQPK